MQTCSRVQKTIQADCGPLRITKRGSVLITTTVMGKVTKVRLLDVQYAENLERNIIFYDILEAKGFGIAYMDEHRVVTNIDSGLVIFGRGEDEQCSNCEGPR